MYDLPGTGQPSEPSAQITCSALTVVNVDGSSPVCRGEVGGGRGHDRRRNLTHDR